MAMHGGTMIAKDWELTQSNERDERGQPCGSVKLAAPAMPD